MANDKVAVPEARDLVIGKYTLTATGLRVTGRPSLDEHESVGVFIKRTHQASGWWLADWLRYGDSRGDWQERLDQVVDAGAMSAKTAANVRAIGAIEPSRRRESVSFSHHAEVAGLAPAEQSHWLERAELEGWTQRELRQNIRAFKRTKVIEGQAVLAGRYRVIYSDPPWSYTSSGSTADGSLRKAVETYPTMSIEDICRLPVAAHAHDNAVLFLWVTATHLLEDPGPREVIKAWGFTPKTGYVWDKVLGMPGSYSHVVHEHLIVATRGSCLPDVPTPQPKSVQTFRRQGEHSSKPAEFRKLITSMYTSGPYLELFGRERVDGWTVFGNDARVWGSE
jgi:N6-adenosine-specific RNA methylase IME4